MAVEVIKIAQINMDGTQTRDSLDEDTVVEYQGHYKARTMLPPLVVFRDGDGTNWLADGFHRLHAMLRLNPDSTVRCEVREGTKRDAIAFGFTANNAHGRRRTNADKRRAVRMALDDDEWRQWSDRQIADLCGVHHQLVATIRAERTPQIPPQKPKDGQVDESSTSVGSTEQTRKGKDGKTYPAKTLKDEAPEPKSRKKKNGSEKVPAKLRLNAEAAYGKLMAVLSKMGLVDELGDELETIIKAIKGA